MKRLITAVPVAACLVLAAASPAAAASVSISVPGDLVEEVPFTVTVVGSSPASHGVWVRIKNAGGRPCEPSQRADDGEGILTRYGVSGAFTESESHTIGEPGSYLLCAWVQSGSSASPVASASLEVTVRSAVASVSLAAKPGPAGSASRILATVTAELRRQMFVSVKPAGGTGCGPSASQDDSEEITSRGEGVQGGPGTFTYLTSELSAGTYLACAWVQEETFDLAPEAATSVAFSVPVSAACTRARNARALWKVRTVRARAAVRRARSRSARRRARAAYGRALRSYRKAQAAVTSNC